MTTVAVNVFVGACVLSLAVLLAGYMIANAIREKAVGSDTDPDYPTPRWPDTSK